MKKMFSMILAVIMIGAMSAVSFAHGGHGRSHRASTRPRYAACTVEGCTSSGNHQHDGTWYCAGDYAICPVENCAKLGLHEHDGTYYYCQNHGTGHGCGRNWNP